MEIIKAKKIKGGYVVNDNVGVSDDNIDVQNWISSGGIVEPEFTDLELINNAKEKKRKEIKALRDKRLLDPTPRTLSNGGLNRQFNLKSGDLLMFNTIITVLSQAQGSTRSWEAADGIRYELDINDYKSLVNHLILRDEQEYSQARLKIDVLNSLNTLQEVEAFDINQIIVSN